MYQIELNNNLNSTLGNHILDIMQTRGKNKTSKFLFTGVWEMYQLSIIIIGLHNK